MTISFECTCGKEFRVKDELGGKKSKCPSCGAALVVPQREVELEEFPLEELTSYDAPADDFSGGMGLDLSQMPLDALGSSASPLGSPMAKPAPAAAKKDDKRKLLILAGAVGGGAVLLIGIVVLAIALS